MARRGIPWLDLAIAGGTGLADLFGTKMAANASDRAAEIQAAATREALKQQREMYEQDRADFAPYREAGASALGRLSGLLGESQRPQMPASVSRRLSGEEMVRMQAPTGLVRLVPASQAAAYEARGAVRVL